MNERPPVPPILTPWQAENIAVTLKRVKDVFAERYPGARCHVHLYGGGDSDALRWEISHHSRGECFIGVGESPEAMFSDLDAKLGPVDLSEHDRLRRRVDQLIKQAVTVEATEVLQELRAWKTSLDSSPARQ